MLSKSGTTKLAGMYSSDTEQPKLAYIPLKDGYVATVEYRTAEGADADVLTRVDASRQSATGEGIHVRVLPGEVAMSPRKIKAIDKLDLDTSLPAESQPNKTFPMPRMGFKPGEKVTLPGNVHINVLEDGEFNVTRAQDLTGPVKTKKGIKTKVVKNKLQVNVKTVYDNVWLSKIVLKKNGKNVEEWTQKTPGEVMKAVRVVPTWNVPLGNGRNKITAVAYD